MTTYVHLAVRGIVYDWQTDQFNMTGVSATHSAVGQMHVSTLVKRLKEHSGYDISAVPEEYLPSFIGQVAQMSNSLRRDKHAGGLVFIGTWLDTPFGNAGKDNQDDLVQDLENKIKALADENLDLKEKLGFAKHEISNYAKIDEIQTSRVYDLRQECVTLNVEKLFNNIGSSSRLRRIGDSGLYFLTRAAIENYFHGWDRPDINELDLVLNKAFDASKKTNADLESLEKYGGDERSSDIKTLHDPAEKLVSLSEFRPVWNLFSAVTSFQLVDDAEIEEVE